ncbi:vegetative cell wall protein gp1-like isoform X2 [Sinocyclocheilus anshuiensis]|uniref:vegetative cell wall protein gp1-like isoform X2 n=1 Tax=Sinocyclocheilus anshuiensis TaxID=1608454 RepID=UPI0007B7B108|nr:PREDICTED: vegetative cell wall protein gp1-like isoform X2 [Sinocyclocheilus anshuiensis]
MATNTKPSQRPPNGTEMPEPTADGEPSPAAVIEPSPSGASGLKIAPEPEPQESDQVQEPTAQATVDTAVEIVEAMESPARATTAGGERKLDLGDLTDLHSEIPVLQSSLELLTWENIPPNLPLPPPLIGLFPSSTPSSLDPVRPSAHPQLTICGVGSPLVCPSPAPLASSLEDPSTPPSASEAHTCNPAAPPWLPAPSSPLEPVSPPTPPGSLVPPAPPWSVVPLPPPLDCTPPSI